MTRRKPTRVALCIVALLLTMCITYFYWKNNNGVVEDVRKKKDTTPSPASSLEQATTTSSSTSTNHKNMAFLHVGKTGGATLARLIRRACFSKKGCLKHEAAITISEESVISRAVTRYYHMRAPSPHHDSYLVTLRDPLDRAASWYIFRHPANAGHFHVSPIQNKVLLRLFACYPTFDQLATKGLSSSRRGGKCARLARNIMSGTIQPPRDGDHMSWNYGFYLESSVLVDDDEDNKDLFVVRTEHLWEDWQAINKLLGDDTNSAKDEPNADSHQRDSSTPLPVSDRTLSEQGTVNLCCTLASEIYVYTKALKRAVNLSPQQVRESLNRLEQKCDDSRMPGLE